MSTFEFSAPLDAGLVAALEEWFCEMPESHWSIFQIRAGEPFTLQGYFTTVVEGNDHWQELVRKFPQLSPNPAVRKVEDQDWENAYKEYLKPWSSRDLHWVPVWLKDAYPLPPGASVLYFDAGMAFGTGSHETTQLCAARLLDFRDQRGLQGRTVVDAGCGSGILAISAGLLGAERAFGFDCDPEAIAVSNANLLRSHVADSEVLFQHGNIEEGLNGRSADLIMANIQSDVLIANARFFPAALNPGAQLVLSGVLSNEMESVRDAFLALPSATLEFVDSRSCGDWCDLLFVG